KVLAADPFHTLVYTWTVGGTGVETTVSLKLEERDGGTLLHLEHSGISNYPTAQMATNMFSSFEAGWSSCVTNLEKYLTKANVK
ncbi:MAG: SRPBCC domain-containing protein, partial [Marinoscillum sp.]